jgi:hypothetical protein
MIERLGLGKANKKKVGAGKTAEKSWRRKRPA